MVSKKDDEKILEEARKRFSLSESAEHDERQLALDDLKFVFEEDGQWTDEERARRDKRPTYQFDRVSGALDQILGDQLQNRPGIKIRPAEDSDIDDSKIYTGLIRSIENSSNAKRAYSNGFKFAAACGFGAWMITHDYKDEDSFEQDIIIEPVINPFCVYWDPSAITATKHDGQWFFYSVDISKDEFKHLYPDAAVESSTFDSVGASSWYTKDTVRVADYWRKVPKKKTLVMLSDGRRVFKDEIESVLDDLAAAGIGIIQERQVDSSVIEHYKMSGSEILERPEYVGKYFPIVPVFGKSINVEGKFKYRGIVRKAMSAQKLYNYNLNNYIETQELQPRQPYFATPKMIEGHETQWQNLNVNNDPVLLFNFDSGNKPFREQPAQVNQSALMAMNIFADNIKTQTGIFDASLGAQSNETSGRAIRERDRQGDTATFEFTNEFLESIEHTGRILVDLIPKIIDTKRQVRILGEDDKEDIIEVNKPVLDVASGEYVTVNDLGKGKYDVYVSAGASYSTRRTETAEQIGQIMAQNPAMGQILADVYVKSLDLVDGDEVLKRIRKFMIKQGLIEPDEEELKEQGGDPRLQAMQQQLQIAAQQVQQLSAELQKKSEDSEFEKMLTAKESNRKDEELLLKKKELMIKEKESNVAMIKDVAAAEAAEAGRQIEQYKQQLASLAVDYVYDPSQGLIRR